MALFPSCFILSSPLAPWNAPTQLLVASCDDRTRPLSPRYACYRWREMGLLVLHQGPPCERLQPHWYVAQCDASQPYSANFVLKIGISTTSTPRVVLSSNASTVAVRASPSLITPSVIVATRRTRTCTKTKATRRVSSHLAWPSPTSLTLL